MQNDDKTVEAVAEAIIRGKCYSVEIGDREVAHARDFQTWAWRDAIRDAKSALAALQTQAQPEAPATDGLDVDAEFLRSVASYLAGDETDEGVADAHNLCAIADRLDRLTSLRQPDQGERDKALEEARERGQREGKAAVCAWLRGHGAYVEPMRLHKEAAQLADLFEQSEIPGATQ